VRTLVGHGHRVNTLALSCEYALRTGPFGHKAVTFATAAEAQAAVSPITSIAVYCENCSMV
jgi:ribosome assembly protein 4